MKRMVLVMLSLLLLCGCSRGQTPPETEAAVEPELPVVNSVDGLLSALAPDAQIILAPGTYDLTQASDYGKDLDQEYYTWEDLGNSYGLKLVGLANVTIRGSGMGETVLVTPCWYADVLTLQNCNGITLENFTAGHAYGNGACSGGVLALRGCLDVELNRLGLYGCGTTGVWTDVCTDIRVTGCDIYDCSNSGIQANETEKLVVEDCRFYNLGDDVYGGISVFSLNFCGRVSIANCRISDNTCAFLLSAVPARKIALENCTLARNRFDTAVFDHNGSLILEGNTFDSNQIRRWFAYDGLTARDAQGVTITEENLAERYGSLTASGGEQVQIRVTNVDELLAAIRPDTEILLADGLYDLSTASGYGVESGAYYSWYPEYDGPSLVISGVSNLTIRSESGDAGKCTLSAAPRYAHVLTIQNSVGITLSGITAGHTQEPGYCTGGVVLSEYSDDVLVENCGLYGCGTLGFLANGGSGIALKDCDIYECSDGGIRMYDVKGITLENCTYRDLGGDRIGLMGCSNVTIDGEAVDGYEYYVN